ncbi:MAG: hypothetical protein ABSC05_24820 [Candidatus Solibacter sp.]|jgi:hypothetical protein
MSINRHKPHVLVLPEDDANRQLANGFLLHPSLSTQIQVLEVAGGWTKVLDLFRSDHVHTMAAYPNRSMVLLIDLDGRQGRLDQAKESIPDTLKDRVFVLGVWTEPEALKANLGSYEKIGLAMAEDCREDTTATWGHELLRHNSGEMERLRQKVRPILFQ